MSTSPRPEARPRVPVTRLVAGLAGAAAVSLAAGAAWSAVQGSPHFTLTRIEVEGAVRLDVDEVRAAANVRLGRPLAGIDPVLVEERLERTGWIADARVRRAWPDTLHVVIEERNPRALVLAEDAGTSPGGLYAMDDSGIVFKRAEAVDRFDLPVVTGIPLSSGPEAASARLSLAARLLDLLGAEAPGIEIDELHLDRIGRWSVVTEDGREIVLGPATAVRPALERYARLRSSIENTDARVLRVDVSDPVNAYVRFAEAGAARAAG